MQTTAQRSPRSIEKAVQVFQRFSRAKLEVGRTGGPAAVALVAALLGGLGSALLEAHRFLPSGLPVPALRHFPALAILGTLILLNTLGALAQRHPSLPAAHRWAAAPWPLLSLVLLPGIGAGPPAPLRSGVLFETPRLEPAGNEPWRWRRLAFPHWAGLAPILIQLLTPLLLTLTTLSLLALPTDRPLRELGWGVELYLRLAGAFACRRAELLERRGALSPRRLLPFWPVALLPWGLSLLAPLALLHRVVPNRTRNARATTLFFNRTALSKEKWTLGRGLLPRWDSSALWASGEMREVQSLLRARTALLMLEAMALGLRFPVPIESRMAAVIANLALTTLLVAGYVIQSLEAPRQAAWPSGRRVAAAWSTTSTGALLLGFLMGSSLASSPPGETAAHIAIFGTWATLLSGLSFVLAGKFLPADGSQVLIWVGALMASMALGLTAVARPEAASQLTDALTAAALAAWLLDPLLGLFYQRLFLAPFSLQDLWSRTLSSSARTRLAPLVLALFLPLGGLANALLAVRSQRKDALFRAWWESRAAPGPEALNHSPRTGSLRDIPPDTAGAHGPKPGDGK